MLLSFLALLLLAACQSNVTQSADPTLAAPHFVAAERKARDVTLALSPEARAQANQTLRFNTDTLLGRVRVALESKGILSSANDAALPRIEIVVTSIRVRSAFSAVMFGFLAGDDHINGDVIVRGPDGQELQRFSVSASYALGGLAGGQDTVRTDWLYESFAKRTLEGLTGAEGSN